MRLGSNEELYQQVEGVVELMEEKRLQSHGHLLRIDRDRLTKESSNPSDQEKQILNGFVK